MEQTHTPQCGRIDLPQIVQERGDEQIGIAQPFMEQMPRDTDRVALIGRRHQPEGGELRGR